MRKLISFLLYVLPLLAGCKKSDFLDAKPDQRLIIPESLDELQALLDNINVFNGDGQGLVPTLGEIASDNYYAFQFPPTSDGPIFKQLYTWKDIGKVDPYVTKFYDWDYPFRCIFYSNVVLDGLNRLDEKNTQIDQFNNIKGSALFHRAHMFYQLAQVFTVPYDQNTSSTDAGMPLKFSSDINDIPARSSVQITYNTIIDELKTSADLLPIVPRNKTRPSKPAALALLSRVYQTMHKYDSSLYYANESLKLFDALIDFNDNSIVNHTGSQGLRMKYNPEVIFDCKMITTNVDNFMNAPAVIRVDTNLTASYVFDDLRRSVFFRSLNPGFFFKGSYYPGQRVLFAGIACDEVYLIRAEALARAGNVEGAMKDLNKLLIKRWRTGTFVPFEASTPEEALTIILTERRKELIFRGLRWTDLRRLNQEGANISLTRVIDGQTITLQPNDKRYTFLIPDDVIMFHSDWQQNPR